MKAIFEYITKLNFTIINNYVLTLLKTNHFANINYMLAELLNIKFNYFSPKEGSFY